MRLHWFKEELVQARRPLSLGISKGGVKASGLALVVTPSE